MSEKNSKKMGLNDLSLDYDGNNVCITIKSKVSLIFRVLLISCNSALLILTIFTAVLMMPVLALATAILLLFFFKLYLVEIIWQRISDHQ